MMKIDFTLEQLSILDRAVQQLPYYVAAPLIQHINQQIKEQQEEMDEPIDAKDIAPLVSKTSVDTDA